MWLKSWLPSKLFIYSSTYVATFEIRSFSCAMALSMDRGNKLDGILGLNFGTLVMRKEVVESSGKLPTKIDALKSTQRR